MPRSYANLRIAHGRGQVYGASGACPPHRDVMTDQGIEACRREQLERIPTLTPRVANARVGVQNQKAETASCEVVADRESSLSATDDDHVVGEVGVGM